MMIESERERETEQGRVGKGGKDEGRKRRKENWKLHVSFLFTWSVALGKIQSRFPVLILILCNNVLFNHAHPALLSFVVVCLFVTTGPSLNAAEVWSTLPNSWWH